MRGKNESGVIVSWLVRVVLLIAVIGIVLFDVGSIIVNTVSLSSSAEDVAVDVSVTVGDSSTLVPDERIYDLATEVVADEANGVAGARVVRKGTGIDEEGIVHVRLRRRTDTIVTKFIGPLKKRTIAVVDGQAGTD